MQVANGIRDALSEKEAIIHLLSLPDIIADPYSQISSHAAIHSDGIWRQPICVGRSN
jgi:hypothetical protein